ncbi:MAG: hypothetical protein K9N55_02175 [Phycisphaerae bacterium]|nr:hypothetical protein [Phycisphaerae bacterium]
MKWHKTIQQTVLGMILILGTLGTHAWAQPDFLDDFSDGDPADGSPVTWSPIFVWDGTGYTLTPEGLDVAGALLVDPDGTIPAYRDVAITAGIRRHANDSGAEWASGFLFRYNANWTNGYWMEVRGPNRFLLGHSSGAILAQATLPFSVDEQDLMIHMEAQGSQIKGWCWAKDQSMPEEPQISITHVGAATGQIALHAWTVGGQSIFRSVEISSIKTPVVDFNGDGTLNVTDLATFIETWGTDDPAMDFWHDGTVDKKDLEILMDCWGKDLDDPTLIANWKLDETEGNVAYESAAGQDATVMGEAVWQAQSGQIEGALALDGIDDCVTTPPILDPWEGVFSVFVWVKGGAPGQVLLSQVGGVNWLALDESGNLFTDLKGAGRSPGQSLHSNTSIIDDQWHRIGLVWDRFYRSLYVDDQLVAVDSAAQSNFPSITTELCLGTGSTSAPGTFWAGMIGDVRVYDRVVVP